MSKTYDIEEPVEAWGNPHGARPKQHDQVFKVEVTFTISKPGLTDRRGREVSGRRAWTEEAVLAELRRHLGLHRDTWPKGLRLVEVDAIYNADDDE